MSIITQKGGIGNTTKAIHIVAALAQKKGVNVLLVDFDSQKNLSMGYGIEDDYPYTVRNFLDNTGDFRLNTMEVPMCIFWSARLFLRKRKIIPVKLKKIIFIIFWSKCLLIMF